MRYLLLLVLLFTGCAKPKEPTALRIAFNVQPSTLDPSQAGDFASSSLICMLGEGLTRCLPGGAVEPALAERVEISDNQKVYLFHLRKAYHPDGKRITAHDFEKAWKKVLDPPAICAYLFYPIKNAELCTKGAISIDAVGIHALDDQTLQVELESPTPYFYSLTAFPSFLLPNSGPFRIRKMVRNSEIILEKNPTFWNWDNVKLDEVHISIVPDEMTALHMFERGDLDWVGGPLSPIPPDALEQWRDRLTFIPNNATTFITFNTETFPFQNVHLRKAFSYAIDRAEIVEKVTQLGQIPATRILPSSLTGRKEPLFPPTDVSLAQAHFQKALEELHITPAELESLVLYFKPNQIDKRLAQTLQRQWKETLGVTLQLAQLDFKSHMQRLQNRDYQLAIASWIAQFDDPISILDRFKDRAHLKNYPGWESAEYVRLLNASTFSPGRGEWLNKAETLLAEQMPLTPLYHWNSPVLSGPRIQETGTTPSGGILFERFRLAKKR